MTIDEALNIVLGKMDDILIPAKESAKMEDVKGGIRAVIKAVQNDRAKKEQEGQQHEA